MEDTEKLRKVVEAFSSVRVAVLGDLICDRFVFGEVERISPEAPVPVVRVRSEELKVGGAGNVAHNIATLGGQACIFGVVGKDSFGEFLQSELQRIGIATAGIFVDEARITTLKTRIMAHSQHLLRIDRETTDAISPSAEAFLAEALEESASNCQVLIISDYAKGVLTPHLADSAIKSFKSRSRLVICDPKPSNLDLFKGVDLITPNRDEALRSAGINRIEEDSLLEAAKWLRSKLNSKSVMITIGQDGIFLLDGDYAHKIPAEKVEVYDVVGAGDTVSATTALALGAGADLITSARLANLSAGIVVGKLGLATVSKDELLRAITSS